MVPSSEIFGRRCGRGGGGAAAARASHDSEAAIALRDAETPLLRCPRPLVDSVAIFIIPPVVLAALAIAAEAGVPVTARGGGTVDEAEVGARFERLVAPSLQLAARIGSMHTNATYVNLCSLLLHASPAAGATHAALRDNELAVLRLLRHAASQSAAGGVGHPHIANMLAELGARETPHQHAVLELCPGGTLARRVISRLLRLSARSCNFVTL